MFVLNERLIKGEYTEESDFVIIDSTDFFKAKSIVKDCLKHRIPYSELKVNYISDTREELVYKISGETSTYYILGKIKNKTVQAIKE